MNIEKKWHSNAQLFFKNKQFFKTKKPKTKEVEKKRNEKVKARQIKNSSILIRRENISKQNTIDRHDLMTSSG